MSPTSSLPAGAGRNLADLVSEAARRDPSHLALIEATSGQEVSWGRLDAAVDAEAVRLIGHGLRPGQRVVLRMPTSVAFCVSLFGLLRVGGVAVPVGTGAADRELDRVLEGCGASLLIAAPDDVSAQAAAERMGVIRLEPPSADGRAGHSPLSSSAAGEDLAVLAFTSGTSGQPRGVMLSHRALLANLEQCAAVRPAPMTAADRVLLSLPLFHSYGLGPGLLQVANSAATAVLLERFEPEEALRTVYRYRVTVVMGVPPMYRAWLRLPPERLVEGMRTVRLFSSGAAPLSPAVLAGIREVTGLGVFEGYGLTETGPVVTSTLVGGVSKPGSVGRPLPGVPSRGLDPVELRLVDAAGRPLPTEGDDEDAGGTGMVAVRGPNLFSGYWPDGAFGPAELPGLGPGWIRTGDVGYLDADGDLHLVDRADDLIIVNGFNVYPREVEDVLCEHPGVREAAAIGVPHARTGEAVRAVLVPVEGEQPSAEEIVEHCAARLARFKVPVEVALVESLPQLPTGKLARRRLRESVDVVRVSPGG
ncbi:MAG: class I adenylate-forming enzyme family protein [Pseudonocardiaceae bacterium]